MKFRWCVIGAGGIADRRTIPAILLDEGSELVALSDRTPCVAERLGKKYGAKFYTDEEKMLGETPCDAVYIATPVALHYAQATSALKRGCHVLLEKPLAMNAAEGEKLASAFRRAGRFLQAGYMMRHHNLHEKAKELVQGGAVGQINDVRVQFSCWYPDIPGAWRQDKSLSGGGAVMDLGVHCIDLAEYVLGEEISSVAGFYASRSFSYSAEDSAVIAFGTVSGVLGHIDVNFNLPDGAAESKLEIYGTAGSVVCTGTLGQEEDGTLSLYSAPQGAYDAMQNRSAVSAKTFYGEKGNLFLKEIVRFRAAASGEYDGAAAEQAVHVQRLVDEFYRKGSAEKTAGLKGNP